jgi:hypothetical protein
MAQPPTRMREGSHDMPTGFEAEKVIVSGGGAAMRPQAPANVAGPTRRWLLP